MPSAVIQVQQLSVEGVTRFAVVLDTQGAADGSEVGEKLLGLRPVTLDVGVHLGGVDAGEPHAQLRPLEIEPKGVAIGDGDHGSRGPFGEPRRDDRLVLRRRGRGRPAAGGETREDAGDGERRAQGDGRGHPERVPGGGERRPGAGLG